MQRGTLTAVLHLYYWKVISSLHFQGCPAASGDRDHIRDKRLLCHPFAISCSSISHLVGWFLLQLTASTQGLRRSGSWSPEPRRSGQEAVAAGAVQTWGLGHGAAALQLLQTPCESPQLPGCPASPRAKWVTPNGLHSAFQLSPTVNSLTQCSKSLF